MTTETRTISVDFESSMVFLSQIQMTNVVGKRAVLEDAGFPSRLCPRPRSSKEALKRAIREETGAAKKIEGLTSVNGYVISSKTTWGYGTKEDYSVNKEWAVALTVLDTLEFTPSVPTSVRHQVQDNFETEAIGCGTTEMLKCTQKVMQYLGCIKVNGRAWLASPSQIASLQSWGACFGLTLDAFCQAWPITPSEAALGNALANYMAEFTIDAKKIADNVLTTPVSYQTERWWTQHAKLTSRLHDRVSQIEKMLGVNLSKLTSIVKGLEDEKNAASLDADLACF